MRVLAVLLVACSGCVTLQAGVQSVEGELQILAARKPIAEVLRDPGTPGRIKRLLLRIEEMKGFGEANHLRATENYQDYVRLRRSAVVYVVTACQPLRFQAKTWSFPIAGQFPYLGWFNKASADQYAADLARDGWDVDEYGATAFSTLGFFRDPVLSTMIVRGAEALGDLADVVLHESVHATLHIQDQAVFNESLATFVGDRLAERYLDLDAAPAERAAWLREQDRRAGIESELHQAYLRLEKIYAGSESDAKKRQRKAAILGALGAKLRWPRPITNATLIGHRTYESGKRGFSALLEACRGDFSCFFDKLRTLKAGSFRRQQDEDLDAVLLPLAGS
jgi:predicted aminopeptidase